MADMVYFTSAIDPASGDTSLIKVEQPTEISPTPLIVCDPTNADPTLARFYEVKDEKAESERSDAV